MESLHLVSPIELVNTNMAVASLNAQQKDRLYMNDTMRMAMGRDTKEDDFLYFTFKLCHLGKNNNLDIFTQEELEKDVEKRKGVMMPSWKTPEDEPIDYDHNFNFTAIIGDIYQSVFVRTPDPSDDDKPYIKCAGVIYSGIYPDMAFKVARGSRLGYAKVSMEVRFALAIQTHEGRLLRGLNFKGAALTRMPADKGADIDPIQSGKADTKEQLAMTNSGMMEISVGSQKLLVPKGFVRSKN